MAPFIIKNCHCDHRPDECSVFNPTSQRQSFKIILIGTSGGAQVALAAAPYLDEMLRSPCSLLGCFAGRDGFNVAERVYHLRGRRDWVEDIGHFSHRAWPATVGSAFNRLQGDIQHLLVVPTTMMGLQAILVKSL